MQGCGGTHHENRRWKLTPDSQLVTLLTDAHCASLQSDHTINLEACTIPVPQSQTWSYDHASQQLTVGGGWCVTADPNDVPGHSKIKLETITLGRPLSKGSFAVLMINNKQSSQRVTCDQACLARLHLPDGVTFSVMDLINGQQFPTGITLSSGLSTLVPAGYGTSVYLRLDPK